MWEFPSVQGFIYNHPLTIFFTLFLLFMSVVDWWYVYFAIRDRNKKRTKTLLKRVLMSVFLTLVTTMVLGILILRYSDACECRSLDLSLVKALRVRKMHSENLSGKSNVLFNDSNRIRQGLELLKKADSRGRQGRRAIRESFSAGYQIELILENDSKAPVLYYFAESDRSEKADVIIPHCQGALREINVNDNIYTSSDFGNWVDENIQPLFKELL